MSKNLKYVDFDINHHFGLEFEFSYRTSRESLKDIISNIVPRDQVKVTSWQRNFNNTEWICKPDSSCGFEIVTPVLSKLNDLNTICKIVDLLKSYGVPTNKQCGIHVHVESNMLKPSEIARIIAYWIKIEKIILFLFPKYRRSNKHCQPLRENKCITYNEKYLTRDLISMNSYDKYQSLNIRGSKRGTLEYRLMEGTLDSEAVVNWTTFCLYFFQIALDNPYPKNLRSYNFSQFWSFLRLEGQTGSQMNIFSSKLHNMRLWMLKRLRKYTPSTSSQIKKCANKQYSLISEFQL